MDPPRPPYHLSTHDVGVHRMGTDPATSVTDIYGEVHECQGLYAVGGGQFVSYGGYNPNQTVQALAYLSSEELLRRNGSRPIMASPQPATAGISGDRDGG